MTLTLSTETAMDRLQDALRSSPNGLCELMAPAVVPSWREALAGLRDDRALDIVARRCTDVYHPGQRGTHLRYWWRWAR